MRQAIPRTFVVILAAIVAACGSSAPSASPSGSSAETASGGLVMTSPVTATVGPSAPGAAADEGAIAAYGYGPSPDATAVLQPDVVVVGGGATAILGASDDGTSWRIDRSAPRAADLREGDVMFVTSRAVGRVVAIRDGGDARVVTLAPVLLEEVIKDAQIDLAEDLDAESMSVRRLADLPGIATDPAAGDNDLAAPTGLRERIPVDGPADEPRVITLTAPVVRLASYTIPGDSDTVVSAAGSYRGCDEFGVGSWSVKPCYEPGKIGLGVDFKAHKRLKLGASISLRTSGLKLRAQALVANGLASAPTFLIDGITGIDIAIAGGAEGGVADNAKIKVEVPFEWNFPIPPGPETAGVPLNTVIEFKFIVETAFSGNNSTLSGAGSYRLTGPIGIENGKPVTPELIREKSLIESIGGITLGPSGIVFAVKLKVHEGIGIDGFVAGPYAFLTVSVGISKGSVFASPVAVCVGGALKVDLGIGVGMTASLDKLAELLPKSILDGLKGKVKTEHEVTVTVFAKKQVVPDVPLCRE